MNVCMMLTCIVQNGELDMLHWFVSSVSVGVTSSIRHKVWPIDRCEVNWLMMAYVKGLMVCLMRGL